MPRNKNPLRAAASNFAFAWGLTLPALIGASAALVVGAATVPTAEAKSPGSRYCFHGFCHRVGTLAQTDTLVGWRGYVLTSYYDSCHRDRLNPCGLTSSGSVFRPDLPDNAASPLLPDGTVILAYNPKTGDASILRINNAGPYSGKRKLDVSRAAADKLGFRKQGVTGLVITVLQSPTKAEASYVRRRVYPAVPGYIGKFETVETALEAASERFDVRQAVEKPRSDTADHFQTASLGDVAVPQPRLAVSPSLARELVMLRSKPRPVTREPDEDVEPVPQLVHGPRLVDRAAFKPQKPAPAMAAADPAPPGFASGLLRYLLGRSGMDNGG